MSIGTRIKSRRLSKNKTLEWLAEQIGTTRQTIHRYETGEILNIPSDKIELLAKALDTTPSLIMGWDEDTVDENMLAEAKNYLFNKLGFRSDDDLIESSNNRSLISLYKAVREHPSLTKEEISVHLYGDYMNQETGEIITRKELVMNKLKLFNNPVSAGFGTWLDDGCEYNFIDIDNDYVKADFALKVKGDSMSPLYNDGDIVFIKSMTLIEPGQIGVFVLNDEGYLKQWQGNRLISINQNYKPIQISEIDKFFIVGKVVDKISENNK